MTRFVLMLPLLLHATPAPAQPLDGPTPGTGALHRSIRLEVARVVGAEARSWNGRDQAPAPRRNWFQRHPARTAAIVGAVSGFLVGYLPGDDAVFDDYVAEFNGLVVGGIGAGAAASIVGIIQALRKPLPAARPAPAPPPPPPPPVTTHLP